VFLGAGSSNAESRVAFSCQSSPTGDWNICTSNSDGSNPQISNLSNLGVTQASGPSWSPDGTQITFQAPDGIWVMDADFGNAQRVLSEVDLSG
jgi:Tol biopolymer transport system component